MKYLTVSYGASVLEFSSSGLMKDFLKTLLFLFLKIKYFQYFSLKCKDSTFLLFDLNDFFTGFGDRVF